MMYILKHIVCPMLASVAVLLGTAYATTPDPASTAEIAIVSSVPAIVPVDLSAPDLAPEGVLFAPDGSSVTIAQAGVYRLSGKLAGQLIVDADGEVELILAGVSLQGPECLSIQSKDDVTLTLASHTLNVLLDGLLEADEDAAPVLRSKAPLTIGGDGALTVKAGGNNALYAKDGLTVTGGELHIYAASHGIKATGPLTVTGGDITIAAGGDGLQAEDGRIPAGTINIAGGTLDITSDGDGLQAQSAIVIAGGQISVTSGGGGGDAINQGGGDMFGPMGRGWNTASATGEEAPSTKGLKSDGDITITGGVISLSTADDSIHCARLCSIDGGEIYIYASDDAIHSDDTLRINDGSITVYDCFEGLEAFAIEVHGGTLQIYAVNDCVNANGSEWGERRVDSVSGYEYTYYWQSGGTVDLVVYSYGNNMGDGMDSNGSLYVTGGHLTVSTPGTFMENGIDTGWGYFVISGGEVIAGGGSAMQETPSSQTDQCIAMVNATLQADTTIYLRDSDGNDIWSYTFPNYTACIIVSHPAMTIGNTYTLTYGDTTTELDFTETNYVSVGGWGGGFGGGRGGRPF